MFYAVGDIHGERDMLEPALDWLHSVLQPEDTVVFLGDYIDRGEESRQVVEHCLEFQMAYPQTVFLRGNHEQMLLDSRDDPPRQEEGSTYCVISQTTDIWLRNGGYQMLASYDINSIYGFAAHIPDSHWNFFDATQMEWETEDFWFVHAGLTPEHGFWEHAGTHLDPRLWIRDTFLNSTQDWGKLVIFGHTPQRNGYPLVHPNKVGLDTGAIFGGRLSIGAFAPGEREKFTLFQVERDENEQPRVLSPVEVSIPLRWEGIKHAF